VEPVEIRADDLLLRTWRPADAEGSEGHDRTRKVDTA
jgi:hypothetical protein